MVITFKATDGKTYTFDVCAIDRIYHNGEEQVVTLKDKREFSTWSVSFASVWC